MLTLVDFGVFCGEKGYLFFFLDEGDVCLVSVSPVEVGEHDDQDELLPAGDEHGAQVLQSGFLQVTWNPTTRKAPGHWMISIRIERAPAAERRKVVTTWGVQWRKTTTADKVPTTRAYVDRVPGGAISEKWNNKAIVERTVVSSNTTPKDTKANRYCRNMRSGSSGTS
eukprot:TRINITY_DN19576_c0_g1_i2.p2 TRINITY_DN19576_c0_g1~~TRINITY_DN19576_c0_g1_i2.p2  ORF type:complete len:168 (+),score=12.15 TRINITY_DN19576_c0_g1_i2:49-552(+)